MEQPVAKKCKTQGATADDGGGATADKLSIKIYSMDGSCLNVGVAHDADIGDVKGSIREALNPVLGTAIQLHASGVEEPLKRTERVSTIFVDNTVPPALFMFQSDPTAESLKETLKDLDAAMKNRHQTHTASSVFQRSQVAHEQAYSAEVTSQDALIQGTLQAMRDLSDGSACQICNWKLGDDFAEDHPIDLPVTLEICQGRCRLLICSTCRPSKCENQELFCCQQQFLLAHVFDGAGDCCDFCWPTKFHDKFGKCQCGGCINAARPRLECDCSDNRCASYGLPRTSGDGGGVDECTGECDAACQDCEGQECRRQFCSGCADDEESHAFPWEDWH